MRDVDQVLAEDHERTVWVLAHTRGMSKEAILSWWFEHIGRIDMAYEMGLITEERFCELCEEWETHYPA